MKRISVIIIGAGSRGTHYSGFLKEYPEIEVVAVAEPRDFYRDKMGADWNIPAERRFRDWREVAALPERIADAAVIATSDNQHTGPAIALANRGYHLLLEKPMAPTLAECEAIVKAAKKTEIIFAVCHVLRYTTYTQKVKELLDSGVIGELVNIQHIESVMYWHQAHSYVRGNWRNEEESSSMLLAKSCHDIDLFRYWVGRKCKRVSSFGGLKFFRRENQPAGAADRCTDCPKGIESQCPYSAVKIYWRDRAKNGYWRWPIDVVTEVPNRDALFLALKDGPYGRCVFACDNDVVDHQTVIFEFENGVTVDFTMTAFTPNGGRRHTRFCGTRGYLEGDGAEITCYNYLDDSVKKIELNHNFSGTIEDGHGGGDGRLVRNWVNALVAGSPEALLTGPDETLESHRIVFAAEQSRRENRTIVLPEDV